MSEVLESLILSMFEMTDKAEGWSKSEVVGAVKYLVMNKNKKGVFPTELLTPLTLVALDKAYSGAGYPEHIRRDLVYTHHVVLETRGIMGDFLNRYELEPSAPVDFLVYGEKGETFAVDVEDIFEYTLVSKSDSYRFVPVGRGEFHRPFVSFEGLWVEVMQTGIGATFHVGVKEGEDFKVLGFYIRRYNVDMEWYIDESLIDK